MWLWLDDDDVASLHAYRKLRLGISNKLTRHERSIHRDACLVIDKITRQTKSLDMSNIGFKITLSFHQRQMLRMIAERGGSVPYRFGVTDEDMGTAITTDEREEKRKLKEGSDASIRAMATMLCGPVIEIRPIVGALDGRKDELYLTDIGRNVVAELKLMDAREGRHV